MIHERFNEIVTLDNFYPDPEEVRNRALAARYGFDNWSLERYFPDGIRERIQAQLGVRIVEWPKTVGNGDFLLCTAEHGRKGIHTDGPREAISMLVYLTPEDLIPPDYEAGDIGTFFWRHKDTGFSRTPTARELKKQRRGRASWERTLDVDIRCPDKWEVIDRADYGFNRFVAFPCDMYHSSGQGFGTNLQNGRILHSYICRAEKIRS